MQLLMALPGRHFFPYRILFRRNASLLSFTKHIMNQGHLEIKINNIVLPKRYHWANLKSVTHESQKGEKRFPLLQLLKIPIMMALFAIWHNSVYKMSFELLFAMR
jgi:hypothetical protein